MVTCTLPVLVSSTCVSLSCRLTGEGSGLDAKQSRPALHRYRSARKRSGATSAQKPGVAIERSHAASLAMAYPSSVAKFSHSASRDRRE